MIDGEVVALDEEGRPASFQRIQHRIHVTVPGFNSKKQILTPEEQPVAFVAFDLLRDGDRDLRSLCLYERRELLEALFERHKPPASQIVRLTVFLTEAEYRHGYMRVRDAWVADPPPASTLIIVKALALPACKVEIEAIAAA